jgi:predicted outer membrane repeat protein
MSLRQRSFRFFIVRFTIILISATFAVFSAGTVTARLIGVSLFSAPAPAFDTTATFTVTNTNDSGPGSLRQAVLDANAAVGADTITFAQGLAGVIPLSTGQLSLTNTPNNELTIVGPPLFQSGPVITISGTDSSRIFSIPENSALTMSNVTLTNGRAIAGSGGAIVSEGNLTLTHVRILNSRADLDGGGLAIGNGETATLFSCGISNNLANADSLGSNGGGGIYIGSGSTVTITESAITENSLQGTFVPGGGIFANGATLNINNTYIGRNVGATDGGGILVLNGMTDIFNSTFELNTASRDGGAVYAGGQLLIQSTHYTVNIAGAGGGAIFKVATAPFTLQSSTVTNNTAAQGGGLNVSGGTNTVQNTIVGLNSAPSGPQIIGSVVSGGFNLFQSISGAVISGDTSTNIIGQDPLLGPLQDNGGPTTTRAPLPNSPVIDKGKSFGAITDQRGFLRPVDDPSIPNAAGGDGTDIGAVELQGAPTPTATPTNTPSATPTNTPTVTPTSTPTATPTVTPTPGAGIEADVAPRPNGDGGVNSTDVVQLRRFATGLDVPDPAFGEPGRADCAPRGANDGNINSGDVVQGRRYAAGLDPLTNARPFAPTLMPQGIASAFDDMYAYFFGRELRVITEKVEAGRITIAVEMVPYGDEFAAGFTLEYDERIFFDPRTAIGDAAPENAVLTVNTNEPGRIGVLVDSPDAFVPSAVPNRLVLVTFEVRADPAEKPRFGLTDSLAHLGFSDAYGNTIAIRPYESRFVLTDNR